MGNFDSYGWEHGQNMYAYRPSGANARWHLLPYDSELSFGTFTGNEASDAPIFTPNNDSVLSRLLSTNLFRRALWRGLHDVVNDGNGPMSNTRIQGTIEAGRMALAANGYPTSTAGIIDWADKRKDFVRTQLTAVRPLFEVITTSGQQTPSPTFTVEGRAPVEVRYIYASNTVTTVTTLLVAEWTTVTNWRSLINLDQGLNSLRFIGHDRNDKFLSPNDTGNFIDNWNITRQ